MITIVTVIFLFSCTSKTPNFFGNVTYVKGKVFILSPQNKKEATKGNKVYFEDKVRTERKSAVELQLKSFGLLRVGEQTLFELSELNNGKRIEVRVDRGKAGLFINKIPAHQELIVSTSTVTAAVRGTKFLIESDGKATMIALFGGAVELKNDSGTLLIDQPGEITLQKNMKISLNLIKPLSPESIAQMNALENMNSIQVEGEPKHFQLDPDVPKSPSYK